MKRTKTGFPAVIAVAAIVGLAGCSEGDSAQLGNSNEPTVTTTLSTSLSFGVNAAALTAGLTVQVNDAGELVLEDETNTLVIRSAEVVLREIELERVDGECDVEPEDDCEDLETGPMLVALPTDGSVERQISVEVTVGTYDEVEFEIHKVGGDDEDDAFLEAHPEFDHVSVRVQGSWNGVDFTYTSDDDAEQEIELAPPLVVEENTETVALTLSVDLATWFTDGGTLIDPNTALDGGGNEDLVEDNIEQSFEIFEDDDEDGEHHDGSPHT